MATIVSNEVTVTATAPTVTPVLTSVVAFSSASTTDVGESVTITATAYDQNGNYMSNVTMYIIEVSPHAGTYAEGITGSNGTANFTATFESTGTHTLYAKGVSGTTSVDSSNFSINVLNVLKSISLSPSSETVSVGANVSFTVTATDSEGDPDSGISITVTEEMDVSGHVTVRTFSAGNTNSGGRAYFSLTFNTAGRYIFSAASEGIESGLSIITVG